MQFVPAALLYVVFAMPGVHLDSRATTETADRRAPRRLIRDAAAQVAHTVQQVRANRDAFQFLVGRFLYSDAIATLSAFLAVYMTRLGGFSESEKNAVLGISVVLCGGGGDRHGAPHRARRPRAVLVAVLPAVAAFTLLSAAVGSRGRCGSLPPRSELHSVASGPSDRVFMLRLTPDELRGEFFASSTSRAAWRPRSGRS